MIKIIKRVTAAMVTLSMMAVIFNVMLLSSFAAERESTEYTVNIQLMQFHSEGTSMGNASVDPEAHIYVDSDGTAQIEIDLHSMTYLGKEGYLGWLKKVDAVISENEYHYPLEIETTDAKVLEEYVNVYDDFNDPTSDYYDAAFGDRWYPKKLAVSIDFANQEDDVLVQVYVPVMESIMSGAGTKFAVLDIDWSSLEKADDTSSDAESITPTTDNENKDTDTEETNSATDTSNDEKGNTDTEAADSAQQTDTEDKDSDTKTPTQPVVTPSEYDKENLEDGTYELFAEMIKVDRESYSMSNNGINHTVQLEVKNGEYYITVQFKGLAMYNQFGYLQDLYYYNKGYTYNEYGQPQGNVSEVEVLSSYDVVDQYNDAEHLYPQLVKFPLVDKAGEEFVPLRVFVPIMEAISEGTGSQNVLMRLDWSTLKKTEAPFNIEEQEKQSNAFDFTDSATGVILHADQGVLPNGTVAEISAVSNGSDYDTAKEIFSDFILYNVSVSDDLNGKMQVSLPIPSNVSDPTVYRITDGKKTKINGTSADGYFTFSVKEVGNFAIGSVDSAKSTTGSTTSSSVKTTSGSSQASNNISSAPQTGDAGADAAVVGFVLAGIVAYLARRKEK